MHRPVKESTLNISRKQLGRTLVLTLDGEAGIGCVDMLESELARASAMRPQHVLIDLTHLGAIAALVNGTLSMFANAVRKNGGDVRFLVQPMRQSA